MPRNEARAPRYESGLMALVAISALTLLGTAWWEARRDHEVTLAEASQMGETLASAAAGRIESTFRDAANAAISAALLVESQGGIAAMGSEAKLQQELKRGLWDETSSARLVAVAPDGAVAASSTGRDKPIRLVPPDARWQVEMRGRPPLSLGMPMRSPFDDQWVVPLWVPVGSAAGQAMGWIRVEIRSSYMERFIERLPGFHMGSLVIMTTDGFGVIRVPHDESVVGVMRPGVVEFLRLAQGESGTVEFAPRTDNRLRLYSWKRLPAFPIAVAVGFEKSLVLAEWRRRTGQRALVSIVFSAAIAALTFGLMVYARRARSARERTEHLLRNLNSELESKIAERTAALKLANEDLEAFTYSVAHDLRGPIARLAAFVDLLERDLAVHTEPVGRRLAALRRQAREMNALVDDLLAFARAGSQAMSADRVDMDQLASQVRDEIEPATAGRSIEWFVDPLPGVHGDSALLREVWRNLIGNAVKYTAGRDPARIAIGTFKASATEIGFFIKDNGAGFDETYADQLFAPFRRLHSVSEFEGTGVGLAIVHRILRRHGGRIWGRGTPGAGASFCFTLRL